MAMARGPMELLVMRDQGTRPQPLGGRGFEGKGETGPVTSNPQTTNVAFGVK